MSAARRTSRGDRKEVADQHRRRRDQQHRLAIDEMERVEAEAFGHGGARRQRHHDAEHHQAAEGAEQPAVDRAPSSRRRLPRSCARDHRSGALRRSACRASRARGNARRALRNWGTGRRRRRPATAARPARAAPLARRVARGGARRRRRACRSARRRPRRRGCARNPRSPRRSDRPCATRANSGRSGSMPPSFGLPPRIQIDVVERQQRLLGRVGVGRLGIVDEQHVRRRGRPAPCDAPGRGRSRARAAISPASSAERPRGGEREGGVLARCARRAAIAMPARSPSSRALAADDTSMCSSTQMSVGDRRTATEIATNVARRSRSQPRSAIAPAVGVVDADQRDSDAGDQPLLDRRVVLHRAVAVEMIGREIDAACRRVGFSDGARSIWKDEHSMT